MCVPWTLRVFLFLISHFLELCLLFLHDFDTIDNAAEVVTKLRKFSFTIVLFCQQSGPLYGHPLNTDSFLCPWGKPFFSNWINCCWMTLCCFFVTLAFSRHFSDQPFSKPNFNFFCAILSDQPFSTFSQRYFNFSV